MILAIVIAVVPLAMIKDSEFEGSDGQAEEVIEELSPDYEPWAENIMEPPGAKQSHCCSACRRHWDPEFCSLDLAIWWADHAEARTKTATRQRTMTGRPTLAKRK